MSEAEHLLVLIRHGNSEWNQSNRFTGWTDIPLADQGLSQADVAARRLSAEGIYFDEVHTSVLQRTHQTADILLAAACHSSIPRFSTWRLNERHYGQLQGLNKHEIFNIWGTQKSNRWWRGYFEAPPPLELTDPRHPRFDPLYKGLDSVLLPCSESLFECQRRLLPYWHEVLTPNITGNKNLLVISHGNTLRSLIMYLEKIAPKSIEKVEIPMGVPLIYRLNKGLKIVERKWLKCSA